MLWQVKLAYQESELASQLKKLSLGAPELAIIRDRAEKLRDGRLKTRGDALLPIILASFIFDSLCAGQGSLCTALICWEFVQLYRTYLQFYAKFILSHTGNTMTCLNWH